MRDGGGSKEAVAVDMSTVSGGAWNVALEAKRHQGARQTRPTDRGTGATR